jgi:N-acetylglucosamine-6-sulfatase
VFNEEDLRRRARPNVGDAIKEDLERTYRAALRSLQSVDDLVAAVTGKLDNTVVIYTSDNGFLFDDHRLVGKTAAYEGRSRYRSSCAVLASPSIRPAISS